MRYHDQPDFPPFYFIQQKIPDLALRDEIQHGTDLVCNQKPCLFSQCPCNTETLQFPSGQFLGIPVHPIFLNSQPLYDPLFNRSAVRQNFLHFQSGIHSLFRMLPDHLHGAIPFIRQRLSIQQNLTFARF